MIFRHPAMFHPPPNALGKSKCDNQPHIKSKPGCPDKTSGVLQSNIQCLGTDFNLSTGKQELINDSAQWGRRRGVSTYKHPPPRLKDKYNGTNQRLEIIKRRASTNDEDQCPAFAGC